MRLSAIAVLSFVLSGTLTAQQSAPSLPILPTPVSVRAGSGHFALSPSTVVVSSPADAATAEFLRARLREQLGRSNVAPPARGGPVGRITLTSKGGETLPNEGYRLVISPTGVTITGRDAGLFYGVQSLLQLVPAASSSVVALPAVTIEDYPRFAYRGMHLDVSRHFFGVDEVKRYIDVMAAYKLNNFHWHLTDDNGWRVEIKRYPKLTQVGGFRAQTTIGHYWDRKPQWYDGTRHGGFYTQDEIRDVVRYAAARHVNIVPEIEMPGHATAALAAYPELSCDPTKPYKVAETFGVWTSIFCPTETTFTFLQNVLAEVIELFPSKYIHVGGDETPEDAWKTSAFAQQLIREKNLKDEHGLQSYFIRRIETFVNSKGRSIIGWDEILDGGLAPNATVMSWRGEQGGIAAARARHDVIMASQRNALYFNDRPSARTEIESQRAKETLRELYQYNPIPAVLSAEEAKHIKGVTGAIWTEYVQTGARLEYTLLPRMLALSEIAWTPLERKDYRTFTEVQLPRQLSKLETKGYEFRVPVAVGPVDTMMQGSNFTVTLKPSVEGARIHYTIDGYPASETDAVYTTPLTFDIPVGQQRELQTVVVTPSNRKSIVTRTVMYNRPQPENNRFNTARALVYRLVKGPVADLAAVDRGESVDSDTASTFDLSRFRDRGPSFGVSYDGSVELDLDGTYTFELASAGPSRLFIDERLVVDNPGGASETVRSGQTTVLRGLHRIRVVYAQQAPGRLGVAMTTPASEKIELRGPIFRSFVLGKDQTGIDAQ